MGSQALIEIIQDAQLYRKRLADDASRLFVPSEERLVILRLLEDTRGKPNVHFR